MQYCMLLAKNRHSLGTERRIGLVDLAEMDHFDEKLRMLETNSFDQKMQQYYSKMKKMNMIDPLNNPEMLTSVIDDHRGEILDLRNKNDRARRTIACLESDLAQLRAQREAESNTYSQYIGLAKLPSADSNMTVPASNDLSHIKENRRRERQATTAVAEHDANLIRRLQDEMTILQSTYEADIRILHETNERISHDNKEKDLKILKMEIDSRSASSQIRSLTSQLESVKQLLEIDRSSLCASSPESAVEKGASSVVSVGLKSRKDDSRPSSANTRHEATSSSNRDENNTYRIKSVGTADFYSTSTSKLTASSRFQNTRPKVLEVYSTSRTTSYPLQDRSQRESAILNSLRKNGQKRSEKCSDDDRKKENSSVCERDLRAQNAKLLLTLEGERCLLREQESALNKIRDSALEITLLEAEEIARLEQDLITSHDENNIWQKRCISAEFQAERLSQQLNQLESLLNHDNLTFNTGSNNVMQ